MNIFIIYAREDQEIKDSLSKHLLALKDEFPGLNIWHDGLILGGTQWEDVIQEKIQSTDIFLLLISVDFLNSDFIRTVELRQALEKNKKKQASVVPVICRSCQWNSNREISVLNVLPSGGVPIKSKTWDNEDYAYTSVTSGVRKLLENIKRPNTSQQETGGLPHGVYKSSSKNKRSTYTIAILAAILIVVIISSLYYPSLSTKSNNDSTIVSKIDSQINNIKTDSAILNSKVDTHRSTEAPVKYIIPDTTSAINMTAKENPKLAPPVSKDPDFVRFSFYDDFSDNSNDWPIKEDEKQIMFISNGKFSFETKIDTRWFYRNLPIDLNKDFEFTIKCRWNKGIVDKGFGMLFCGGDYNGKPNYLFTISANGYYIIRSYSDNSDFVNVTEWKRSSYINQFSLVNELKIRKSKSRAYFYINDSFVEELPFDGGYGPRFGFVIVGKQLVEFDDYEFKGIQK